MIYIEWNQAVQMPRIPESMLMDQQENVDSYDIGSNHTGSLEPLYYFAANELSKRIPLNGHMLDLGSGSGRFTIFLKHLRPDIRITAIELSSPMIIKGQDNIRAAGLTDQDIRYVSGDFTTLEEIEELQNQKFDLISSILSIHHLPDLALLRKALGSISKKASNDGASVFIFDHARPKSPKLPELFAGTFTKHLPRAFQMDAIHSIIAAFTLSELQTELQRTDLIYEVGKLCRLIPVFQYHTLRPKNVHKANPESQIKLKGLSPNLSPVNEIKPSFTLKKWIDYFLLRWLMGGQTL